MELKTVKKYTDGVVRTTGNALGILANLTGKLDPLARLPIVGGTITDLQDMVCMLRDYFKGEYKNVPTRVLIGCGAIVLYLAIPYDIIPDNIPILGFVDDAFVIKTILSVSVSSELDVYRLWKAQQPA